MSRYVPLLPSGRHSSAAVPVVAVVWAVASAAIAAAAIVPATIAPGTPTTAPALATALATPAGVTHCCYRHRRRSCPVTVIPAHAPAIATIATVIAATATAAPTHCACAGRWRSVIPAPPRASSNPRLR